MKRQRGRGRKPGGGHNFHNQPNRTMESNGPDVKVRGPVNHIYERYLQLARDAASSGDRVLSENYLQHADHYFRLWRQLQPSAPVQQISDRLAGDADEAEGAEEDAQAAEPAERAEQSGEAQAEADAEQGDAQQERGEGDFRRGRRGRRSRFRPSGEGGEGGETREANSGGGEGRERQERGERRERPQREGGERDQGSGEGFSYGPKPAFLGSD